MVLKIIVFSWWAQFRAILWRSWLTVLKEPLLVRVRLLQTVVRIKLLFKMIMLLFLHQTFFISVGCISGWSNFLWTGINTGWCYEY